MTGAAGRPVARYGDGGLVATVVDLATAHGLAAAAAAAPWAGVEEVVVGARSVTVVVDPDRADLDEVEAALARLAPLPAGPDTARTVTLPVVFDGPDLAEVGRHAGIDAAAVVDRLAGAELTVAFVGFAPGFPYLVGLPPPLDRLERRRSPRASVPAGSVAVAGGFAGVYPGPSPGGWHLVGRTSTVLFDPHRPPFSLLHAGDRVRFEPRGALAAPAGLSSPPRPPGPVALRVEAAGPCTLVQDRGRVGHAAIGVPRAGPADAEGHRLANRLVGNPDGAAALELAGAGPGLLAQRAVHLGLVGDAEVAVDGRRVPAGVVVAVPAGARVSVGPIAGGGRAYLAVSGGVDVPAVLGSRSTDVLAGIGGGPLRAGDGLGVGPPGRPRAVARPGGRDGPGPTELRVVPGPDRFPAGTIDRLAATRWRLGPDSNRVGLRLEPEDPTVELRPAKSSIASRGVVSGVVQIPPDGRPIVLGCDHATVGGYPVVATVIHADLPRLGRVQPGDPVVFRAVDGHEAAAARAAARRRLDGAVTGWFPLSSL